MQSISKPLANDIFLLLKSLFRICIPIKNNSITYKNMWSYYKEMFNLSGSKNEVDVVEEECGALGTDS
jgi:hypothetical protein